jgi:plasmid maintenance system antidote protein VapI
MARRCLRLCAVAMLPDMLLSDRKRVGWSVRQAAWRLGVSVREYRELEAGARSPTFETWDRIWKLFGWPQSFADS